ncbi:MAG: hypothetical protein AAFR51_00345 [Pseudomonadota bacterium]
MRLNSVFLIFAILALASCNQVQTYQTTFTKTESASIMPAGIDRVVLTYDYAHAFANPENLSIEYFSGAKQVFADEVIIDGEILPLSGAPRSNVFLDFHKPSQELHQWNVGEFDSSLIQEKAFSTSDGKSFPEDGYVYIDVYENGQSVASNGSSPWQQTTIQMKDVQD